MYDYLRLLFARIGIPHCEVCGAAIGKQTPQQIVDRLMGMEEGTRFQILAPLVKGRKGEFVELFRQLVTDGYSRVRVDGAVYQLTQFRSWTRSASMTSTSSWIGWWSVNPPSSASPNPWRLLILAHGVVGVEFVDLDEKDPDRENDFPRSWGAPTSTTSASTSWNRASSPSTDRGVRVPCARGSAPPWRSIPNW